METTREEALLAERGLEWLAEKARKYRVCVLTCLATGALAYMFAFTNKLVNHDEAACLFSKGATVTSGRWGLGALDLLFPNVSMPWIYGVLTVLLIAGAACVLVSLFDVENRLLQGLLGGCVMVFPSLIGTFGYMFTASSYGLAFLLAVAAVWFAVKGRRFGPAAGTVCLVLSLSIYQSYIAVSASLLVLALIRQLLDGADCGPVIRRGFLYLGLLVGSLALYYGATQAVLALKDVAFNDYAAGSITFSPGSLLNGVGLAYSNFLDFFTKGTFALMPTTLSRAVHGLCLVCAGALLPYAWLRQGRRGVGRFALLLGLLALLPLAINCMYLFTSEYAIHTLVLYGFVAVYVLVVVLAQRRGPGVMRAIARNGIALALAVVLASNVYIANAAYLNLYLKYENASAFYTSLVAQIKMTPGFDEGTRLAVVGDWADMSFYDEHFSFVTKLTGVDGFKPDSYSAQDFLTYYLGFSMEFAGEDELEAIASSAEFAEMPVYPYYGSLAKFGDVLVVKLSECA